MIGFWTEHAENNIDSPPLSSEVSALVPGLVLYGCDEDYAYSTFVLRGVYSSEENARTALREMHTAMANEGWKTWVAGWKILNTKRATSVGRQAFMSRLIASVEAHGNVFLDAYLGRVGKEMLPIWTVIWRRPDGNTRLVKVTLSARTDVYDEDAVITVIKVVSEVQRAENGV